jgi:ABC-type branched-subunit amino acid transport system substrate-binding protein
MKKIFSLFWLLAFSLMVSAQLDSSKTFVENDVTFMNYKVVKGKTLYSISKETKISQDSLLLFNPSLKDGVKTGAELKIPIKQKKEKRAATIEYIVKAKETEFSIAKKYSLSVADLRAMNPALENGLKIGMVLQINPASGGKPPKEENQLVNEEKKDSVAPAVIEVNKELIGCEIQEARLQKNEVNIALLLPLFIGVAEEINAKSKIGLDFYAGAKMALDSLRKTGLNAKVFLYDTQNDSTKITEIINKPAFKFMDLIIGPLYTSEFKQVADFAQNNNITIISPFAQSESILKNNNQVLKFTPDSKTLISKAVNQLTTINKNAVFTLIYNKNEADRILADSIKSAYQVSTGKTINTVEFTGVSELVDQLLEVNENVVIFPSTIQIQVIDFTVRLNAARLGKRITLVGLNEWNTYENIDFDLLNNLNFVYAAQMHNNYEDVKNIEFRKNFKTEFKSEPSQYAFQGFDATYFSVTQLKLYGKSFNNCLPKIPTFCGFNSCYSFYQTNNKSGYLNNYVNVLQLVDFKPTKINK